MDQRELDALVSDRLTWTARCASAFAHELGNVVLFTDATHTDDNNLGEKDLRDDLLRHYRRMLHALGVWRQIEAPAGELMSPQAWWREYGGLMRQFARRTVSIGFRDLSANELHIDATVLTRVTSAMILALDMQCDALKQLTIRAIAAEATPDIRLEFLTHPGATPSLLIPTLVSDSATIEKCSTRDRSDEPAVAVVLSLKSAQ